jgi:hypothetical protein
MDGNGRALQIFSALRVEDGSLQRIWFEALDEDAAKKLCLRFDAGYEGQSARPGLKTSPLPLAFDSQTARNMLGGISVSTLYRLIATRQLERLPGTGRVLVTRSSLERYSQS